MYLLHLPDLALMTSLDILLDIIPHPWPPKPIPQLHQHQKDPLVSKVVVGLLDKSIVSLLVRDSLMLPLRLFLPQPVILEEELRRLGHKPLSLLLIHLLWLFLLLEVPLDQMQLPVLVFRYI